MRSFEDLGLTPSRAAGGGQKTQLLLQAATDPAQVAEDLEMFFGRNVTAREIGDVFEAPEGAHIDPTGQQNSL